MNSITPEQRKTIDASMQTQGYTLLENAITDVNLISRLKAGVDRTVDEDLKGSEQGIYKKHVDGLSRLLIQRGQEFIDLIDQSPVQEYVDTLLSDTCVIQNYTGIRILPQESTVVTNGHKDSPRYSPNYLLAMQLLYFLDDFTPENGATWVLPGSHATPTVPDEATFRKGAVQIPGKAGSVLICNSSLTHAAGINSTPDPRRGISVVYTRSFVKPAISVDARADKLHVFFPEELHASSQQLVQHGLGAGRVG